MENGPFTVDLSIIKVVIFHSYVSLPKGASPKAVVEICRNES
jgi:hypothetical protein